MCQSVAAREARRCEMNEQEREAIALRRERGEPINKIAKALGLNYNTVKSFCQRQNISIQNDDAGVCENCGKTLPIYQGGRRRRFCSDKCRHSFWSKWEKSYQKEHICPTCGVTFKARSNRKYCSHACYIKDRFRGTRNE